MTRKTSHLNVASLEVFLRLSVLPLCVASAVMVVQANDSSDEYGSVRFSNISGFKFLFSMDCIAASYAFASATLLLCRTQKRNPWVLFVLDQLVTYLMVTSSSAAAELLYLAYEGDREVSWSEVCSYFGRFCSRAKVSLFLHFVALFCFVCVSLLSAMRVLSAFGPPSAAGNQEREEAEK
ncbi:hypothetical protein HPP92_017012 [Vanilla planifolia]|uniref:CASP-like protein n=1 Tax=Vanilla planifolia TaxID=51239 RepID=A0A835QGA0_VANPL|nr:hypothetical protein HPP92_017593 [Vanilla planifolia]KAG0472466.1 hypothetical protein HPP92_017012 [Vanilla planifolia]